MVQKDLEDVSTVTIFTKNKVLNKFSCNLRPYFARSTLTSPGPIRVNVMVNFKHLTPSYIFVYKKLGGGGGGV
jgi:hypothetical protein